MRITKFGHACIRLERDDGGVVVVDPGAWTSAEAVEGADAVLVTHEHPDHLSLDHLRAASAPVYTIEAVAAKIRADADLADAVTVVAPGDALDIAGMSVHVVGRRHAVIHPSLASFDNSGYLLSAEGTTLFHPGDSFELPGVEVDVLCAPVAAPWLKLAEVMDFVRAVAARHTIAIHDVPASEIGLSMVDQRLSAYLQPTGGAYTRLRPGQDLA